MSEPWRALRKLPDDWAVIVGMDTGTYMSALFVGVPPGDEAYILCLAEVPNYRYVAHEIELLGYSIPEWARMVMAIHRHLQPRKERCFAWADPNTQFRTELKHYGIDLHANHRKLELRVEITREYAQSVGPTGVDRLLMAPWLDILPYEMEHAKWPDGTTGAGKFERIKEHDHTLDCLEHSCSRRPRSKDILRPKRMSFKERYLVEHGLKRPAGGDPHLGVL